MEGAELKITAGDLARNLMANGLVLIGDGQKLQGDQVLMPDKLLFYLSVRDFVWSSL
jgi:actin-like ATPase involved in cell morphogenesis